MQESRYGLRVEVPLAYEQAIDRTTETLKAEGFGVLTTIDVKQTLKQKLDRDFRKYVILGACNPPLAHRALSTEPDIGLLLPCNVVVYAPPGGDTVVPALDPVEQLKLSGNSAIQPVAQEVRTRLERVVEAVAGAGSREPDAPSRR